MTPKAIAATAAVAISITIGGILYTGTVSPVATTPPPVTTQAPTLPTLMMTSAYPLNQPATQYPAETRSLDVGNPYVPAPIVAGFQSIFGTNHIQFNPTMRITLVNTLQTPNIFTAVTITTNWGSDDASHVPAIGCKIEGATASDPTGGANGDRHCLIYDAATGLLHELFAVSVTNGVYSAMSYRMWDTTKNQQGAVGQNSADAAGLPILPLLLRYAEAATGNIPHALRMTINLSRSNANGGVFTAPASHASGQNWSSMAYMGQRLYLRADYPTTGMTPIELTIIKCLKSYGVVIADNGISGLIVADNDSHWGGGTNATNLPDLATMELSDFVIVNSGPIIDSTGAAAQ